MFTGMPVQPQEVFQMGANLALGFTVKYMMALTPTSSGAVQNLPEL
jgi:hypothetical protein